MGYKLAYQGQMLAQFVAYLDIIGAEHLTINHAVDWAKQPSSAKRTWWAVRLSTVRAFARYLSAFDPATEIPPAGLIPAPSPTGSCPTSTPKMTSPSSSRLGRSPAYHASRGHLSDPDRARPRHRHQRGEAVRLDRDDVDLQQGLLTIRNSKYGKSCQIPVHPSTVEALAGYAHRRDSTTIPPATDDSITTHEAAQAFSFPQQEQGCCATTSAPCSPRLVRESGLAGSGDQSRPPRLHDLRHRFAVETLIRWYRQAWTSSNGCRCCPPTWVTSRRVTYWYMSAAPELLELVADRLDASEGRP